MLTTSAANLAGVEELAGRVTITVEEAAAILGIGRSAAYEAARRGQLPTRRLGRRLFVPVPALLRWLGADEPPVDGSGDRRGPTVT
jgi:excisionase family DNA binding protein